MVILRGAARVHENSGRRRSATVKQGLKTRIFCFTCRAGGAINRGLKPIS